MCVEDESRQCGTQDLGLLSSQFENQIFLSACGPHKGWPRYNANIARSITRDITEHGMASAMLLLSAPDRTVKIESAPIVRFSTTQSSPKLNNHIDAYVLPQHFRL
jgi:hypothetical protein